MIIRKCQIKDVYAVYNILKANGQIGSHSVVRPKALKRIVKNKSAIFLVAEVDSKIVGMVRGICRALEH